MAKNLSHIEYYTYKQKGHYTHKYPKKSKTSSSLGNLYFDNWEDRGNKRIRIGILHLVFRYL